MAIYRLLRESSFGEADAKIMCVAYEFALAELELKDREDALTQIVASKIIEVFRTGEREPLKICTRTLTELGARPPR